ncbi:enoyl-CoA hydratase/isomerase family protein [Janibacter sp. G1551]|uniref:enoyl-CoA hydratase/isomerase family protein n=1 Tax=Janibacter sp. G1551 TaxID=3420440 RepID=UPI003D044564
MEPLPVSALPMLSALPLVTGEGVMDPVVVLDLDDLGSTPGEAPHGPRKVWLGGGVDPGGGRLLVGVATRPLGPRGQELAAQLDVTYVPVGPGSTSLATVAVDDPLGAARVATRQAVSIPGASLTLAGLLRTADGLDGQRALTAESFAYSMLLAGPEYASWLRSREQRPQAEPPAGSLVRVDRRGDRLDVVLDHPRRRNAYSARLRDELHEALRVGLLDDSVTSVVLSGAGPSFCAGGDLDEFGTTGDPVLAHLVRTTAGVATTLEALRPRLEVRVHGPCVGAGVELAAFGTRVVARADATFRLPEVLMGLLPGAGGTVSITRRIGRWRLLHLCLSGEWLDARGAHSWGLVDEVEQ